MRRVRARFCQAEDNWSMRAALAGPLSLLFQHGRRWGATSRPRPRSWPWFCRGSRWPVWGRRGGRHHLSCKRKSKVRGLSMFMLLHILYSINVGLEHWLQFARGSAWRQVLGGRGNASILSSGLPRPLLKPGLLCLLGDRGRRRERTWRNEI